MDYLCYNSHYKTFKTDNFIIKQIIYKSRIYKHNPEFETRINE